MDIKIHLTNQLIHSNFNCKIPHRKNNFFWNSPIMFGFFHSLLFRERGEGEGRGEERGKERRERRGKKGEGDYLGENVEFSL